jgi:hypothetical protein
MIDPKTGRLATENKALIIQMIKCQCVAVRKSNLSYVCIPLLPMHDFVLKSCHQFISFVLVKFHHDSLLHYMAIISLSHQTLPWSSSHIRIIFQQWLFLKSAFFAISNWFSSNFNSLNSLATKVPRLCRYAFASFCNRYSRENQRQRINMAQFAIASN